MSADTNARVRRCARDRAEEILCSDANRLPVVLWKWHKTTCPHPCGRVRDLLVSRSHRGCLPGRSPARGGRADIARACPPVPTSLCVNSTPVTHDGDLLWTPSPDKVARANLTAFTAWLARERGLRFGDYDALWRWSVTDLAGFWQAVWDYCGVTVVGAGHAACWPAGPCPAPSGSPVPGSTTPSTCCATSGRARPRCCTAARPRPLTAIAWETLAGQVRMLATRLQGLGRTPR